MTRHIATALLVGMGIASETPRARASESTSSLPPARRLHKQKQATCRPSEFGHLKSAGRFRRSEIATLFIDDGMLFAEWTGQVDARQPRRIETEELDAEWMAHIRGPSAGEKWFLTRRELVASDGKLWSIQIYGDVADPAELQIIATATDAMGDGAMNAFTVNYTQSSQSTRITVRGNHEGMRLRPWTALAANFSALRQKCPVVLKDYLDPALAKILAC